MTEPQDPFAVPEQPVQGGYGPPPGYPPPPPYGPPPGYGAPPVFGAPPVYGQPPYGQPSYGHPGYGPASGTTNGMAIASLVLGILWIWWIGSILALVFGYIAKKQIRERGESGGGMATAGIVLGYIGVGILSLLIVLGIIGALSADTTTY